MTDFKCPGQDTRYWTAEDIYDVKCPFCGHDIEFFKDEPFRICPKCEEEVRNPKIDLGCAKWCKFAKKCLGVENDSDIMLASMCQRLVVEMQRVFDEDKKRIDHAMKVLRYAEQISKSEPGDPLVIRAAAILHDIGIQEAERKHGSSAGNFQEIEGPPIAEKIMKELELEPETIKHVCRIIGSHHSAKDIDTPEFRIIWDADWLVNIPEECPDISEEKIIKIFKTESGKKLALQKFTEKKK
jgi:hypothetical protein